MQGFALNQTIKLAQEATKVLTDTSGDSDNQAVVILVTGFVVVFLVLLLLIGIIKIYSGIVCLAQNKSKKSKSAPVTDSVPATQEVVQSEDSNDDNPDLQTIAVITAAVEAYYSNGKKVRITGISPTRSSRSEWATAGLYENLPAMRSEGLL